MEQIVPARWFFAPPGAKHWHGPHGAEASPWLKEGEVNEAWGEVRPYRGLDRGQNGGYKGQCFVGKWDWFQDGNLPADVLTGPTPPYPDCCRWPSPTAGGGLTLGGSAVPQLAHYASATGGFFLGPAAMPSQEMPAFAGGGLILGGAAVPYGPQPSPPWPPSPSWPETWGCDACTEGAAYQYVFAVPALSDAGCSGCNNASGRFTLSWAGECNWVSESFDICEHPDYYYLSIGDFVALQLGSGPTWSAQKGSWDCLSPLVLGLSQQSAVCSGWPETIEIRPV